jgi:hypothetical protein
MRKGRAVILVFCLAAPWLACGPARSQESAGLIYSKVRQFVIPFQAGPGEERLRELKLFVSADQGRTWQPSAVAAPEEKKFRFVAERDGLYWFSVQSVYQDGRLFPATMDGAQPSLKVLIDTQPPTVKLRALPPRNGEVGVEWEVHDDNLDLALPDALRLEHRLAGGAVWLTLRSNPVGTQFYWNPETNGVVEVRLRVRDRAGNWGEATTTVSLANQGVLPDPSPAVKTPEAPATGTKTPGAADPDRLLVNSKRISLNYELKEVGPSGVSAIDLWYTQDGRSWQKWPLPKNNDLSNPPGGAAGKQLIIDVHDEGLYGFTLVAKSGVGLGEQPPRVGDRPQIWVEVDLTKPVVQLQSVVVGQGADKGKLTISWTATDKNLGAQPITISYAEQATGSWTPIVQNQANTGRYVWSMPETVPYQFLVRVEAVDRAGNVGEAVTPNLVKVDLAQPKVKILNVEPVGK